MPGPDCPLADRSITVALGTACEPETQTALFPYSSFASLLDLLLSSYVYHCKLFASGEEFLSAAPTLGAPCLIVDIHLGKVSGLELVRALCVQGFASPLIFITASWNELHRRRALDLGCAAFFLKPFSPERLIEAVAKAIGSKLNRDGSFPRWYLDHF